MAIDSSGSTVSARLSTILVKVVFSSLLFLSFCSAVSSFAPTFPSSSIIVTLSGSLSIVNGSGYIASQFIDFF